MGREHLLCKKEFGLVALTQKSECGQTCVPVTPKASGRQEMGRSLRPASCQPSFILMKDPVLKNQSGES